jgi:hypothetical protein
LCVPVAENYKIKSLIALHFLPSDDHVNWDEVGEAGGKLGADEKCVLQFERKPERKVQLDMSSHRCYDITKVYLKG